MFDHIAPRYDLLNRLMTLGIDKRWRRRAVAALGADGNSRLLDIATGTADMALLLHRLTGARRIVGVDLSEQMLGVGRRKVEAAGLSDVIELRRADSLSLPFDDNTFSAVTVAYGVRNFADLEKGYREMLRVLRPGGVVSVLELSTPTGIITAPLYRFYTRVVIPALGRLLTADPRAYTYLPESIAAVPQGRAMTALMLRAGFENAVATPLTFGACTIYTAYKPTK